MYEFKFSLSDNDYLEFLKYNSFNNPLNKKVMLIFRFSFPIIALLFVIYFMLDWESFFSKNKIIYNMFYIIFAVVWVIAYKPFMVLSLKWQLKSMKKHGKLPYNKETVLRFDEDSYTETTPQTEVKTKYTNIERIVKSDKFICFYINSMQATIVPLSIFKSEEYSNYFWDFINTKWNDAKKI